MMRFKVTVTAVSGDNPDDVTPLGMATVSADDAPAAEALALDELWDSRLDASGCLARFTTTPLSKYLVAEGWEHIFEGFGRREVRFVFDAEAGKLTHLELYTATGWCASNEAQRADVEDSVKNGNEEALENPEDYGLTEANALPDWVASN